jgi:hypothetical protein
MTRIDSANDQSRAQVQREYALLADGERGAIVGPRGDIVWMCSAHRMIPPWTPHS